MIQPLICLSNYKYKEFCVLRAICGGLLQFSNGQNNVNKIQSVDRYVTKNVCTGEGGTVTTDDKDWAEKVQMYGLHGMSKGAWHRYSDKGFKHYQVVFPGYKYNRMDIQASLGIHQLKRVGKYHKIREKIWI